MSYQVRDAVVDFTQRGAQRADASLFALGPDGARWRVALRRDFYDHQSWIKAQRFDGAEWHDVRSGGVDLSGMPPTVAPADEQRRAATLNLYSYLVGTWARVGLPGLSEPPDPDAGEYRLEVVVLAPAADVDALGQSVVDFVENGDVEVLKWEVHAHEDRP